MQTPKSRECRVCACVVIGERAARGPSVVFAGKKNNKPPRKVNDHVIKLARVGYLCRLSFLHLDNVWKSFNRKTVTIESTLGRY